MSKTIAKLRARVRNRETNFYGFNLRPPDFRVGFEIEGVADGGMPLYLYVSKEIFEKLREDMELELTIRRYKSK